jgi:ATP/maltotriose-dependent transcriptional regulator MalT
VKHLLLLTLILAFNLTKGQSNVDSLKNAIGEYPDSTELYLKVARPYLFSNIDSAYLYLNKGLELAIKKGSTYELGRVYDNLGIYYGIQSNYDSALFFYSKSIRNFRKINNEFALANVLNNSGLTQYKKGDNENAINNYQEAVDLYIKLDQLDKAARTYNNLGILFEDISNTEKALLYFEQSINIAIKLGADQTKFMAMNGKAEILNQQGKYQEAIILFDSLYHYFKENDQAYFAAMAANNLGKTYIDIAEFIKAKPYLIESLAAKKQFNDQEMISTGFTSLAELYQGQKQYAKAIVYVDSALMLSNKLEDLYYIANNTRLKSEILHEKGSYKKSSELFAVYVVLQDSLNDVLQTETITELNNKYEIAKKDKELATLTLVNEKKLQELKLARIRYFAIGLAILLIASAIIFYLIQQRQKDKLRQSLLNEEMDGLRLRIARIMSDVKLDEITIDKESNKDSVLDPLTEREVEILEQAVTNKSNAEIANALFISANTVKYHLKNIYSKIGVNSKLEARAFFT